MNLAVTNSNSGPRETGVRVGYGLGAGSAAGAAEGVHLPVPGPWTFATSSFALSLLAMAILVNRIHHLVPPRRPTSLRLSPLLRLLIRLPSLLLLLRAIFLLAAVLGARHGYALGQFDGVGLGAAKLLGWGTAWAGKSTLLRLLDNWDVVDKNIMWEVFVGTAAAVVTETFVRALDDDLGSQTNFVPSSLALAPRADPSCPRRTSSPSPSSSTSIRLPPPLDTSQPRPSSTSTSSSSSQNSSPSTSPTPSPLPSPPSDSSLPPSSALSARRLLYAGSRWRGASGMSRVPTDLGRERSGSIGRRRWGSRRWCC